jgi:SagB-type dehydrogenase family enzyme
MTAADSSIADVPCNGDVHLAQRYVQRMLARRVSPPYPPGTPRPVAFTTFAQAPRIDLERCSEVSPITSRPAPAGLPALGWLLRHGNGLLGRKLDTNWMYAASRGASLSLPFYARAAPSGGGLAPAETYLAARRGGMLPAGAYHYQASQHVLERLGSDDAFAALRACLPGVPEPDLLLVLCGNLWRSAHKYREFSYYLVTQDLGFTLGAHALAAELLGWAACAWHWFDDGVVAAAAGAADDDLPLAVLGLWAGGEPPPRVSLRPEPGAAPAAARAAAPALTHHIPGMVRELHGATAIGAGRPRLLPERRPTASPSDGVPLPRAPSLTVDEASLRARVTTWGGYRARPTLPLTDLASALRFVTDRPPPPSDLVGLGAASRLVLHANHVAGLAPGVYALEEGRLLRIGAALPPQELQRLSLQEANNFEQPSAVLAFIGRFADVLTAWGNRGLRALNGEIGRQAQLLYAAASAMGLGATAICGFDTERTNALFGADGDRETVMQIFLLGRCRSGVHAFRYHL